MMYNDRFCIFKNSTWKAGANGTALANHEEEGKWRGDGEKARV